MGKSTRASSGVKNDEGRGLTAESEHQRKERVSRPGNRGGEMAKESVLSRQQNRPQKTKTPK